MPVAFFAAALIVGLVVVVQHRPSFGSHETETVITVEKGPGAARDVTRTERGPKSPDVRPGLEAGGFGERTIETKEERPDTSPARVKTINETHDKTFLESLVGNSGLWLLQLVAVFLGAFLIAGIVSRVCSGNYALKFGMFELPAEEALVESGKFDLEIAESVDLQRRRMEELEELLKRSNLDLEEKVLNHDLSAPEFSKPAVAQFVQGLSSSLSQFRARSGLPDKPPAAFEEELTSATRAAPEPMPTTPRSAGRQEQADHRSTPEETRARPADEAFEGVEPMERLLRFMPPNPRNGDDGYRTLVRGMVARSAQTYDGICSLLRRRDPAAAGTLVEPLLEDVVVTHWLLHNRDDHDWLVRRFLEHRDAMAGQREAVEDKTPFKIPFSVDDDGLGAAKASSRGWESWWDPGTDGRGNGDPVHLAGVAAILRREAGGRARYSPPPIGGSRPFPDQLEVLIHEWLGGLARPTVIGLPFSPGPEDIVRRPADPTALVGFAAAWLFALQIYRLAGFEGASASEIERIDDAWFPCLKLFGDKVLRRPDAAILKRRWKDLYRV